MSWRGTFKDLSQPGGWTDLDENLRAHPFKDDLSIDTTFIQIYLDGHYL